MVSRTANKNYQSAACFSVGAHKHFIEPDFFLNNQYDYGPFADVNISNLLKSVATQTSLI